MLKWLLTGGLVAPSLLLCGALFLIYLRGYPFRSLRRLVGALRGERGSGSARVLMQALGGTLGVGNVVGVANALCIGGAGAILWMWVSALLAMILKYAEILLAVRHRRMGREGPYGGAAYYVRDCLVQRGLPRAAAWGCAVFSALMLLDSLSMGCMIQMDAVGGVLWEVVGVPPLATALLVLLPTLLLLARGRGEVALLSGYLVPLMSGGYLLLSLVALVRGRAALPDALARILREALSGTGFAGGAIGFLTSRALRVGTMRGVLSNEAGCGTATGAHAAACVSQPAAQGAFGIAEVLVDTVLLCTVTALTVLVSGVPLSGEGGVMLTVRAYATLLGEGAAVFMALAILCFGFATVLCWGRYGLDSAELLLGRRARPWYLSALALCAVWGAHGVGEGTWAVADFSIAALCAINLGALLLLRREILEDTLRYFSARPAEGILNKKRKGLDKIR